LRRSLLLPAIFMADHLAGDPEWLPHPVRLMGLAIQRGEGILRHEGQSRAQELVAGGALTGLIVSGSYFLTRMVLRSAYRQSNLCGRLTEIVLGWTCLAARNLRDEALAVEAALAAGEIDKARHRVARIVGRDTQQLDLHEISRAVIETLAESASDGIVAPLFYMSIGGVPLAMAYKAVNTLDSMIGHADERYFYFGKAAARLDDVANFVPARLTAMAIIAASWIGGEGDARSAGHVWIRDGAKHKSLNAGQPESAMSGALQVRLGGGNFYDGKFLPAETIGAEFPAAKPGHVRKAIRLVSVVTLLGLGAGILMAAFAQSRRSE
jgi:adenosylcobinamide-phosphate synthase